ncbi:MAG: ABC transporter ATP-binding protein [Desulfovibrionaceae bacterium]|nr:ABC transporter ATP-binding protein [Desulfovibrionaceae bacterium]
MLFIANSISKRFALQNGRSVQALHKVDLAADSGELTALVGPDGAGKTTLLRIIAGLLMPQEGTLSLNGVRYRGSSCLTAAIGYMPQKFGLYEDLTVAENLELYADLKEVPLAVRAKRFAELLSMSALQPFTKRLAGNLSGGMKQKLGLICTLIAPPKLLLLDEPTVGVDPLSRRELWEIIRKLTTQTGMAVIVSTSYLDEAERATTVCLLFEGRMLAQGTAEALCQKTAGLACHLKPKPSEHLRDLLARLEVRADCIDALPEAGKVRYVSRHPFVGKGHEPVPARLEDTFMLLLREHMNIGSVTQDQEIQVLSKGQREIIRTEHVFRYFGDFAAVCDVSFSVQQGEVFGLLGPNGAGKTTTFRMLCGLLPPSKGRLLVAGVDMRASSAEARRNVGYVAQKFSLYEQLTVRENLAFFAGAYGVYGARARKRIQQVVLDFGLGDWLDIDAEQLPGGIKRSLAMAVGLLHEPQILFLDEPTSGADPLARRAFWRRIRALSKQGVTTVVTTHFMEEAEYCDHILIQDAGLALAFGTPEEIRAGANNMEEAFIAIVEAARKESSCSRKIE